MIVQPQLSWRTVDTHGFAAAADCVTRAFLSGDALSQALGVPVSEFGSFVKDLLRHSQERGLSLAGMMPGGVPAAVGINTMLDDDFMPSDNASPTMAPIFAFLAQLSDHGVISPMPGRRIGHLWMAAVAPEYRGLGLLRQLLHQRLENLLAHGADDFVVEATHPRNVSVLTGLPGSLPLRTLAPRDFVFRGAHPFASVEGVCVFLRGDVRLALASLSP